MADILFQMTRGKLKGQVLKVHQMCNDWIIATDQDGNHANGGQPINPKSTYFDWANRLKVIELQRASKLGQMFHMSYDFEYFITTGKFRRIKP